MTSPEDQNSDDTNRKLRELEAARKRATAEDFITIDEDGSVRLDAEKAKRRGALAAVRDIHFDKDGRVRKIKLYGGGSVKV
jgi:hypothetical protein